MGLMGLVPAELKRRVESKAGDCAFYGGSTKVEQESARTPMRPLVPSDLPNAGIDPRNRRALFRVVGPWCPEARPLRCCNSATLPAAASMFEGRNRAPYKNSPAGGKSQSNLGVLFYRR